MGSLYSFVMRGLLTEAALDRTERKRRQSGDFDVNMVRQLSIEILDDAMVTNARKMAVVYTAIAAFENTLREFVAKVLIEAKGEQWWDVAVSEKVKSRAQSRRDEESKNRWHTPRGDTPLNYTEFGDLTSIISNNWEEFEVHLPSQEWVKQLLLTLERSRNVIMHSGQLGPDDVERVGSGIRDWIRQVGV